MKHYLLFASHEYAYNIMRPLQDAIRLRGDVAAWYLESSCPDKLHEDELRLFTYDEVKAFNPIACIVPGNVVYDFFPGIKVEVFHGYPVQKRGEEVDENFRMRGWFDMYCSPGPSSTAILSKLEAKHKYFKYYETGWCTSDAYWSKGEATQGKHTPPSILYAPTFTKGVTSVEVMHEVIEDLCQCQDWHWLLSFHPLITDRNILAHYDELISKYPGKVQWADVAMGNKRFTSTDVMLADSSGVICEYLMTGKPVVTYRNTCPGPHILDCQETSEIGARLAYALQNPPELQQAIYDYTHTHESFFDGKNSERVLDAIDDFIANYQGTLRHKPLNLIRKIKVRRKNWSVYKDYLKDLFTSR